MTLYATMDSPLGELLLVGEESATATGGTALASLSVPGQKGGVAVEDVPDAWRRDGGAFEEIARQVRAYFGGELKRFDVEYAVGGVGGVGRFGTDFQRRVWDALESVPYGTTTSYGKLAERIGVSRAGVRALGTAIGRNPLLVVRPCHRVVGADGSLAGYAGGLERKRQLLELEGAGARP